MNQSPAYVSFVRPVNWDTASALLNTCNNVLTSGAKQIYLLLSSPGGQVDPGFAIYNQLCGFSIDIATHNIGSIDSIANIVFLAGSKRFACSNATFLFHGVFWNFPSQTEIIRPKLLEIVSSLEAGEKRLRDVIVSKTNLTAVEVDAFLAEGATKDAVFAQTKGIINTIMDVNIPPNVRIVQV